VVAQAFKRTLIRSANHAVVARATAIPCPRVLLVTLGKVVHACFVLIAEAAIQDVAGNLFRKLPVFVA